jgi:hypothetical protein
MPQHQEPVLEPFQSRYGVEKNRATFQKVPMSAIVPHLATLVVSTKQLLPFQKF